MSRDLRYLILADGLFGPEESKTANACIRYTPERVVGVLDASRAGLTAQQVLGFGGDIPVVATLDEGLALQPNALLVGIAPAGGQLPDSWIRLLSLAIRNRLEIWSGLHTFVSDVPELAALARKHNVAIHDLRRPPTNLVVANGRVREVDATIVLTVGTDCNIGKMTTQLQLLDAVRGHGIRTKFAATGQTGILIEGSGVGIDAVIADFIAGAAEMLVLDCAKDADLVLVEGFSHTACAKIEVLRAACSAVARCAPEDGLIALVADVKNSAMRLPHFALDDIGGIAQFIAGSLWQQGAGP